MELRLRNKISTKQLETLIHFSIILIAGLSTILRPSIESKVTLFRVLLPILFLWLFTASVKRGVRLSIVILSFFLYSVFVSYVSRFHTFNWAYNFYYITIFFFYFYYREILRRSNKENIYLFLSYLYKALIILGYLQLSLGGVYFNTQNRLPAINIFFWNENEYAAVLAIFTPLFFLKENSLYKYIWIALTVYMIGYNDAKLAILSLIVFFGGYIIMKFNLFRVRYLGFGLLTLVALLTLFFLREYSIKGEYTIEYFTMRLVNGIFTGDPLEHIGTFNSRSNAVILGIKEFFNSYFLGIGPGNSLLMLREIVVPGTEKWSALSMHNFSLQLVTEMGAYGIGMILFFFLKIRNAVLNCKYKANVVWVFFIGCIISITLLSGAWSNYFYLFILFYAVDFFKNNEPERPE